MAPRKQNSDISISLARNQPPQFASLPSKSPPNAAPPYRLVTNIPEPRLERLRRKAFTWYPARLTYKIAHVHRRRRWEKQVSKNCAAKQRAAHHELWRVPVANPTAWDRGKCPNTKEADHRAR